MITGTPSDAASIKQSFPVLWWVLGLTGIALAVFGCIWACRYAVETAHRDDVARMFGGEGVVRTIQDPDRVTAVRIRLLDEDEQRDPDGGFSRLNYRPLSEPVTVSAENADRLAQWLTSGRSYDWGEQGEKACEPSYGVILLFERGDWHVDIWLCFECDVFVVYESEDGPATQYWDAGGDFELIHDELADIMQDLFPDDEAIQEL